MPPVVLMKRIDSGRSSPDSRWRRFIIVTAVRKSDRSFIGAFLPDLFSEIYQFSDISHTPQKMGSKNGLPVTICPLRCTSPRSSQFRVANDNLLDLVGNDREFLQISFETSPSSILWATKCSFCASVLPCRAPWGLPFLMTQSGIEKASSRH